MSGEVKNGGIAAVEGGKQIHYGFTGRERLIYTLMGIAQLALLGYLFYKSLLMVCLMQLLLPRYLKIREEECRQAHINRLKTEFKEMLEIYQGFIMAGYAADNALIRTRREFFALGYENSKVVEELDYMIRRIQLNVDVALLFSEWGKRSGLKDIEDFAAVFSLSAQTGGNVHKIMRSCASVIGEKLEAERDIGTILASGKYEQKIITLIPLFLLLYVDMTSKGFLDVLYTGFFGRAVMTVCLAVYFTSYLIGRRIMNIEV